MHIPDGLLDARTCVGTAVLSGAAVGYALYRVRREFAERTAPLMGVVAACLFAAQMLNFPIPGGTSGHLLGGVLAAVLLGPWGAMLVLTVVLGVQCVLFQDGGITALGANILNLGVIGSLVGFALFEPLRRIVGGPAGTVVGSVVAAWFSVVLSATACSVELALGGVFPLAPTLGAMWIAHTMIGVGEALITGLAVVFVLRTRPDLAYGQSRPWGVVSSLTQVTVAGLAMALLMAVFLSPFASSLPDGLEWALERLGLSEGSGDPLHSAPMADYVLPGLENLVVAGAVAGAAGSLLVFGLAFFLARGLGVKVSVSHSAHAS